MLIETKICSRSNCVYKGVPQPLSNFHKNKNTVDGYRETCKDCCKEITKRYREANRDKLRKSEKTRSDKLLSSNSKMVARLNLYEETRIDPDNSELIQVRCTYDGNWFNPTYRQCNRRLRSINTRNTGESRFYCSEACKEACPLYGAIHDYRLDRPEMTREVQSQLRKMVLERDNWTCQKCEITLRDLRLQDKTLHCHHIDPVISNPIESADIDNCISFCQDCHKWVHREIPGCGTPDLTMCSYKIKK